ncbi:hypothetical protein EUTSA_v10024086mg, partial [Eutrema salsugineum]
LPYRRGNDDTNREFSMYFYLPDKKDGLNDLVEKMSSTPGFVDSHTPSYQTEVAEFRIPKFKIEYGFEALKVFPDLKLNDLLLLYHKACVEVDEEGAEAAAATAMMEGCCCYEEPPKRIDFVADHPFIFLIREDKTGIVLFVGQIIDPSKSSSA